jgi:poly-gamma-glutamate synthesis protein (capsule biosynthesis protein)
MRRLVVALFVFALLVPLGTAGATRDGIGVPGPEIEPRAERDSYVLLFTGDVLPHPAVVSSAARNSRSGGFDFSPMLAELALFVEKVDLAICHLEVPLDPTSRVVKGFPRFSVPAELASDLGEAGFDGCSTASNHTFDRGTAGVVETLEVLEDAGLGHTGSARSALEALGTLYDLGGLVVGHSSYSYGFSYPGVPDDEPWVANRIDADRIINNAIALRRRGAGFVVVSVHWGAEFATRPSSGQRSLAEQLASHWAIDLIIGHHPHVLQPIEQVADKTVVFSLGNFLSNQTTPCCTTRSEEGAVLLVRVDGQDRQWEVGEVGYVPTWVDRRGGHVILPALGEEAEASRFRSRLRTAAENAAETFGLDAPGMSPAEAYRWVVDIVPQPWSEVPPPEEGPA